MSECCINIDLVISFTYVPPSCGRIFTNLYIFSCVQEFIGDEKGHVKGIRTAEINWVQVRVLFP